MLRQSAAQWIAYSHREVGTPVCIDVQAIAVSLIQYASPTISLMTTSDFFH